jgi:hypothetical protein
MFADLVHDTLGSSGAASCASTTAALLGRLKWDVIAIADGVDRLFQWPTRMQCGGGVNTGEELEHGENNGVLIC